MLFRSPQLAALAWGQGHDHPIAADAEAAIAQADHRGRGEPQTGLPIAFTTAVEDQEIIAQTLVFAEREHRSILVCPPDPMQSYFERRGPRLDTSLPSVRHVRELIRNRTMVSILMVGGHELEGTIKWQDNQFLALRQDTSLPLVLINRDAVAVLRALL